MVSAALLLISVVAGNGVNYLVGDATTSASAARRARFENLAYPQLGAAFASLTAFEPMGDGQCCRIRPGMRGPSAHQLGFRIDPESDGDQRQYKNDDNGSHGPVCRTRIRRNTGALTQRSPPVRVRFAGCMGRLIPAASRLFNCASVSQNICCGTDFPSHAGYI